MNLSPYDTARWAARLLLEDDLEWFVGGCADVAVTIEQFAMRIGVSDIRAEYGKSVKSGHEDLSHAWLRVGRRLYDPRADLEGVHFGKHVVVPGQCEVFGVDPEDVEFRVDMLAKQWQASDLRDKKQILSDEWLAKLRSDLDTAYGVEEDRPEGARRGWQHRRERDEFVTQNLPPELIPLWERIKGQFHGTPEERYQQFMAYVQDHPGEEMAAVQSESDAKLDALIAQRMAGAPVARADNGWQRGIELRDKILSIARDVKARAHPVYAKFTNQALRALRESATAAQMGEYKKARNLLLAVSSLNGPIRNANVSTPELREKIATVLQELEQAEAEGGTAGAPIARAVEQKLRAYHGTSSLVLDKIKSGNEADVQRVFDTSNVSLGGAYVTNRHDLAVVYAKEAAQVLGGNPVVLEVELDAREFLPDEDWVVDVTDYHVPESHITPRIQKFLDDLFVGYRGEGWSLSDHYKERYDELNAEYHITWRDSWKWRGTARISRPLHASDIVAVDTEPTLPSRLIDQAPVARAVEQTFTYRGVHFDVISGTGTQGAQSWVRIYGEGGEELGPFNGLAEATQAAHDYIDERLDSPSVPRQRGGMQRPKPPEHPTLEQLAATFLSDVEDPNSTSWKDYLRNERIPKIVAALKALNIEQWGPLGPVLGHGAFGTATAIPDGRVLKLTADPSETQASFALLGKKLPHVVEIYGAWFARGVRAKSRATHKLLPMGICIVERVTPLDKDSPEFAGLTNTVIDYKQEFHLFPEHFAKIGAVRAREALRKGSEGLENVLRGEIGWLRRDGYVRDADVAEAVADALAETRAAGVYAVDVHGDNVGYLEVRGKRHYKVYDLGTSSAPTRPHAPTVPAPTRTRRHEPDVDPGQLSFPAMVSEPQPVPWVGEGRDELEASTRAMMRAPVDLTASWMAREAPRSIQYTGPEHMTAQAFVEAFFEDRSIVRAVWQPRLDQIVHALATINVHGVEQFFGSGSFGTAAALDDSHVLKLTTDETEVVAGVAMMGKKLPHVAMVYGAWFVQDVFVEDLHVWPPARRQVGVLVAERVYPLAVAEGEGSLITAAVLETKQETDTYPEDLAELTEEQARDRLQTASTTLERTLRERAAGQDVYSGHTRQMMREVADALHELHEAGIYTVDVHASNIGYIVLRPANPPRRQVQKTAGSSTRSSM